MSSKMGRASPGNEAGLRACARYTSRMEDGKPRVVWECPHWCVLARDFTGPDGHMRTWFSAHRPNPHTVHMLALTPGYDVPLLRQWRVPLQDFVWELPAGVCDVEGESLAETAKRELEEETGWRTGEVHHLFTGTVSPGLTDELYSAFLCLDLEQVNAGGGTGGERIEVHYVPFRQLLAFVLARQSEGEWVDSKIIAHITLGLGRLSDLADGRQPGEWANSDAAGTG